LLASEGPTLTVYDLRAKSVRWQRAIFHSCFKITKISIVEDSIVVHTEKSLKVLDLESYETKFEFIMQSIDKIIHASYNPGERELVTVNSHNFVEVWRVPQPTEG
jgi:repressor of nif and glnA expression